MKKEIINLNHYKIPLDYYPKARNALDYIREEEHFLSEAKISLITLLEKYGANKEVYSEEELEAIGGTCTLTHLASLK